MKTQSLHTKADIVQRLLEEKHITAEEAIVLLMTERQIVNPTIPPAMPIWQIPSPPTPYPYPNPWFTTYTATTTKNDETK